MPRNISHVAILPDIRCSWNFLIPASAETAREGLDESIRLLGYVLEAMNGFVIPARIEYGLEEYPADVGRDYAFDPDNKDLDVTVYEFEDEDGVQIADIESTVPDETDSCYFIREFRFEHLKVNVTLEGFDGFVDRTCRCEEYRAGDPRKVDPYVDPLKVQFVFFPTRPRTGLDSDYMYYVTVYSRTDLWFEQTEIGRENRDRLATFLARLDELLPAETLERESGVGCPGDLERIY